MLDLKKKFNYDLKLSIWPLIYINFFIYYSLGMCFMTNAITNTMLQSSTSDDTLRNLY